LLNSTLSAFFYNLAVMLDIRSSDDTLKGFKLYRYDPSIAAAVIFAIAFFLITILHFYQMLRTRTWFFIPFLVGGLFEAIGYVGRIISATQSPNWALGPYIIQSVLLLVAPAFFAASIYMELGRIVEMTNGDKQIIVRRSWLTKMFVLGDVLGFLMQSSGMHHSSPSSCLVYVILLLVLICLRWRPPGF
jgi:uncharacterized membrane protein